MRCAAWLALLAATTLSASAAADKKKETDPKIAEARTAFEEGKELYNKGRYEDAIVKFERSFELSQRLLIFVSIANAYERLGQFKKARDALARWREVAPDEEVANLDERLKALDERIKKEGDKEAQRAEEQRKREEEIRKNGGKPPSKGPSVPGLAVTIAGGGLVVVGVILDAVAASMRPDAATACGKAGTKNLCLGSQKDGIETSNALAITGDVTWIAGAAAAAAGIVILVVDRPKEQKAGAAGPRVFGAPVVGPGFVGAGVAGSF